MAEPAQQFEPPEEKNPVYDTPGAEPSEARPSLHALEGGGEGDGKPQGNLHSVPGDQDSKSKSPEQLRAAENTSDSGSPSTSKTGPKGEDSEFNYRQEGGGRTRRQRILSRALFGIGSAGSGKSMSGRKKKILLGVGIGGGGGIFILLAFVLFLASSLKIPDVAQHITEFEFARLTRQFAQSAESTSEEALAVESTDDGVYASIKGQYQNLRDNTWGKLDKFRPAKVIQNLGKENGLDLNTHNTLTGRTVLDSVELNGEEYDIAQTSGYKRFVPLLRQFDKFQNDVNFSRNFAPDLISTMEDNNIGVITRSLTAKKIRQELGISLFAWTIAKFQGKTPPEADLEVNREAYDDINEGGYSQSLIDEINQASQQEQNTTAKDVNNDKSLTGIIAADGEDAAATAAASKTVGGSALKTIAGAVDPIYAAALPACIIYQGSLNKSGPDIDAQTAEQQRSYYWVASAADQQKYGTEPNDPNDNLATAVGATNDKLGDITESNPEIRSEGGVVDTSATGLSAESSPLGDYSLFSAIPGFTSNVIGKAVQGLANTTCPILSNLWAGIGIGVAIQLGTAVLDFFTGGGASAGEGAVTAGADAAADASADSITDRLVTALSEKFSSTFSKEGVSDIAAKVRSFLGIKNLTKETAKITGLVGLTVLAKLIVLANSHQTTDGLEQGPDFVNEADSGGNIQAGELERTELFGRPMLMNEVCESNQQDATYVAYQQSQQSAYNRYLSTSDADSLLSKSAIAISGNINGSIFNSFINMVGSFISKPSSIFSSLANLFNHRAFAAVNCEDDSTDYGNVQFGWSQDEENLINSSDSYLQLENQQILDNSHDEDAIASKYAICFGYKYNPQGTSLDPSDPDSKMVLDNGTSGTGSLGTLLSNGDIIRDNDGNVINAPGALCSPEYLTYSSLDPLAADTDSSSPNANDMIMRWRLAMQYDLTLNQLTQEANVTT